MWFCMRICEPGFEWQMEQRRVLKEAEIGSSMKKVDPLEAV